MAPGGHRTQDLRRIGQVLSCFDLKSNIFSENILSETWQVEFKNRKMFGIAVERVCRRRCKNVFILTHDPWSVIRLLSHWAIGTFRSITSLISSESLSVDNLR